MTSGKGENLPLACLIHFKGLLNIDISVVSHSTSSTGELLAAQSGLHFQKISAEKEGGRWESDLVNAIKKVEPVIVFLLYNRIIPKAVLGLVDVPIVNIHPSILPSFKGFKAVDQAIAYGSLVTGVTAHLVDETVDGGRPIIQSIIPISEKVQSYFDLNNDFKYHSAAMTLQIVKWLLNGKISLQKRSFNLMNPSFHLSHFFPNLDVETEVMVKDYFKEKDLQHGYYN